MKKNIYRKVLFVQTCLIILLLSACSKSGVTPAPPTLPPSLNLSVSIDSLVFTEAGGAQNLNVTTNGDNITASVPNTVNWARCQIVGNTVTVTTDALTVSPSERTVDITITATKDAAAKQRVVRIMQKSLLNVNRDSAFVVPNSNRVVEGYLTLSQWYGYSYNDINYSNLTHIDFSFMTSASATDATLVYQDQANIAAEVSYYSDLTDKSFLGYGDKLLTKAHGANVKVLIGLAGATNLQSIFASSTLRAQFVSNIVMLCEQKGYDGIALDYEYPGSNTDGLNILTFMQDLRIAFVKSAVLKNKQMYISMAVPTGDWAAKYYDLASLAKCVDWFSPMTYEYGSATQANINAPLYENSAIGNTSSVNDAIAYYLNVRGVNPLQLAMGVPFYGWQYTGYTGFGASAIGAARATKDMYNDYIKGGTFTQMWDATSQHTYYVNNSTHMMIVYDDTKDFETKSAYIKTKGLKGAMVWELSRGFVSGATDPNPWLTALGDNLLR